MDRKEFLINTPLKELITLQDILRIEYPKSKGYKIEKNVITWWWEDNEDSKPTKTKLDSLLKALQNDWDSLAYARKRKREYPALNDQLDLMYHDMDSWKSTILAIKTKYPKTE